MRKRARAGLTTNREDDSFVAVVRRIVCQNPPWAVRAVLVLAMGLAMFPAGALAQDSTAADRAALEALYEATGGADWADSTNWKTDAPLSQWYGVGTGDRGRVMELELGNNGLTGSIPPELADLADLERLFLHGNGLTGLPRELGRLVNLTDLDLRWNNLTGPVPTWLGSLVNLRRLDLGDNGLTGPLPRELGNLVNVEWLMLHGNNLTGPVPAWLGSLVNLRLLFLGYNGLTGPIPRELANLVNLTFLALEWNALTGPVPASLGSLANLRRAAPGRERPGRPGPRRAGESGEPREPAPRRQLGPVGTAPARSAAGSSRGAAHLRHPGVRAGRLAGLVGDDRVQRAAVRGGNGHHDRRGRRLYAGRARSCGRRRRDRGRDRLLDFELARSWPIWR